MTPTATPQDIETYTRELTLARIANYYEREYGIVPPLGALVAASLDETLGR